MSAKERIVEARSRAGAALASVNGWIAGRSPRERLLLGGMAVVAAGALLASGVWRPLAAARAAALDEIARTERALAAVRAGGIRPAAPADARPLASVLTDSAPEHGLVIQRLSPEGARLSVVLESAPFGDLVDWLAALQAEDSVAVYSARLERRPEPGVVSASLVLER